jgi:putative NADH-flavin reductase
MRLVILGATGGTGRQLVSQALAQGHDVTAVVRDPARLPINDPVLDIRTADVTEPAELQPIFAGQDAILSTLGVRSNKQAGIVATATKAIVGALNGGKVSRFVAVSAAPVGARPADDPLLARMVVMPIIRRVFRDMYADMADMERQLQATGGISWTIFRPPRLIDRPAKGHYRREIGSAVPGGFSISRADLADAMLSSLADPTTIKQIVGVAY